MISYYSYYFTLQTRNRQWSTVTECASSEVQHQKKKRSRREKNKKRTGTKKEKSNNEDDKMTTTMTKTTTKKTTTITTTKTEHWLRRRRRTGRSYTDDDNPNCDHPTQSNWLCHPSNSLRSSGGPSQFLPPICATASLHSAHLTSAPSLTTFRQRLKTSFPEFLYRLNFLTLRVWGCRPLIVDLNLAVIALFRLH